MPWRAADGLVLWQAAVAGLRVALALALVCWAASLQRRDTSLADRVWAR